MWLARTWLKMTDINLSLQIGVVINAFSIVICSAMIIYFVVLVNAGCLNLLDYGDYNHDMYGKIKFDNGTTASINFHYWKWSPYDYGAGVFATMLVCLFGWVC